MWAQFNWFAQYKNENWAKLKQANSEGRLSRKHITQVCRYICTHVLVTSVSAVSASKNQYSRESYYKENSATRRRLISPQNKNLVDTNRDKTGTP